VFEMPVRLGAPEGLGGLGANVADPRFSTGVGLVLHAVHEESGETLGVAAERPAHWSQVFDPRRWFSDLFY
jgi:cell division protein FtsA